MKSAGIVYLVGAGPWDTGLITARASEVLREADSVVYDYLANPELLDLAPSEAERIYVGKKGTGEKAKTQEETNALLVELAAAGKRVVRLKGGDPYVFGRGGEEAEVLSGSGIRFEIVPGISAAFGASAWSGIPLTHREYTSTVTFLTGHEDPTKEESSIDWSALAKLGGTLVVYMGMKNLARACLNLTKEGLPGETPAAVIHRATHPDQRVVTGTVDTIAHIVEEAGIGAPSLLVIGGVVSLRDTLSWREKRPLAGKTIVVTRARTQASRFAALLEEFGARVIQLPTIAFEPPESFDLVDRAIEELESYDWLVFTSPNGVERFVGRLLENGRDLRAFGRSRIAAIGPETAKKVRALHLEPDLIPETYVAEGLVDAFQGRGVEDQRILIPRAQEARETLPDELRELRAEVHVAPVYRTVRPEPDQTAMAAFRDKRVDMVTFTASSTVTNFMAFFEEGGKEILAGVKVASIGPITSEKARSFGLQVDVEPEHYTIPDLAGAVVDFYREST